VFCLVGAEAAREDISFLFKRVFFFSIVGIGSGVIWDRKEEGQGVSGFAILITLYGAYLLTLKK
jgi:hypothetical protein